MSDETQVSNEELDTSNEPTSESEQLNQNTDEPTAEGASDELATIKAKLAEMEAKNKQLFARLKKEQEIEKKPTTNSQPDGDVEWKRKIEFITTKGRELDAESIDEVIAYAKGKGIPYDKALDSPVIKSYLSDKRSNDRVAHATPPPSAGSITINGKNFHDLETKDKEANFSKYVDAIRKSTKR